MIVTLRSSPGYPASLMATYQYANLSKCDPGHVMWWAHNGMQIHDSDLDLNMDYFSNQFDEPVPFIPPLAPVAPAPTSMVSVMTQTAEVPTHSCGTSPAKAQALLSSSMTTTSQIITWTPPYPGSTRRSKHGQAKKPRRQMPFRAMRMHCPGDENIIPLYRPDDATPDIATSTTTASDIVENLMERQVSVAAPTPDMGN